MNLCHEIANLQPKDLFTALLESSNAMHHPLFAILQASPLDRLGTLREMGFQVTNLDTVSLNKAMPDGIELSYAQGWYSKIFVDDRRNGQWHRAILAETNKNNKDEAELIYVGLVALNAVLKCSPVNQLTQTV